MTHKSSEVYRSLPDAIAFTIPRRTSMRESWWREKRYPSGGVTQCSTIPEEGDETGVTPRNNNSIQQTITTLKRDGLLAEVLSTKEDAICVTGQVKKYANFFEEIPRKIDLTAKNMPRPQSIDSSFQEKIKYKVKYPFWDDYTMPKSKMRRNTVSNFPKWEGICREQMESSTTQKRKAVAEFEDICVNRVQALKLKLLNSSAEIDTSSSLTCPEDTLNATVMEKHIYQVTDSKTISIKEPVLEGSSKLFVKPRIQRLSFVNYYPVNLHRENDLTSLACASEFVPSQEMSSVASSTGGRCVEEPHAGGRPASASCDVVRSRCVVQSCSVSDKSESHQDLDAAVHSDASECAIISKGKTSKTKCDNFNKTEGYMVSDADNSSNYRKTMGASNLDKETTISFSDNEAAAPSTQSNTPRVVGAALKSYKDIPEELFNSLPESSVDPAPNVSSASSDRSPGDSDRGGDVYRQEQDWVVMQEGRRVLLESSVLGNNWDASSDGRSSSMSSSSNSKYSSLNFWF